MKRLMARRVAVGAAAAIMMGTCGWSASAADAPAGAAKAPTATGQAATPITIDEDDHAVGGLAALNLYSTFGCLGLTAKGFEAKTFDVAKVQQVTADVIKTTDLAVRLLKSAAREDQKLSKTIPVDELVECYYLLDREARLLDKAAGSNDKEIWQAYYQSRDESWKKISKVLGIEIKAVKDGGTAAKKGQ